MSDQQNEQDEREQIRRVVMEPLSPSDWAALSWHRRPRAYGISRFIPSRRRRNRWRLLWPIHALLATRGSEPKMVVRPWTEAEKQEFYRATTQSCSNEGDSDE